jgi:hypothetical protein
MTNEEPHYRSPVARFSIGQQYLSRGRFPYVCTITDILRTYNNQNVCVALRYVSTHEFAGQIVTDSNVVDATVALGVEALKAANDKQRGRA